MSKYMHRMWYEHLDKSLPETIKEMGIQKLSIVSIVPMIYNTQSLTENKLVEALIILENDK